MIENLKNEILAINSNNFEELAMKVFHFQSQNCKIYADYITNLNLDSNLIKSIDQIPFLPIGFFKSQKVVSTQVETQIVFESSGTTGQNTSRHYVSDPEFYKKNSLKIFEENYGPISNYHIVAMLPSYLEKGNSSLVYMVKYFIESSQSPYSDFYLNDFETIHEIFERIKVDLKGRKILLWGVTFAILELAETGYDFSSFKNKLVVLETGGMKGRRKDLMREELHQKLKSGFMVEDISSEYGMTELLSQAYSKKEGVFRCPNTMRIFLREVSDPFTLFPSKAIQKTGGINIIDLANIDSCSFIETQDLGQFSDEQNSFKVLGRFDNADLRGCNLLIS